MKHLYNIVLAIILILGLNCQVYSASIELYGNYHTMGIIITLEENEDPENDAIATIKYRLLGSDFIDGFPATRTNETQFVGSLFWLTPDNRYEVIVTISDPTSPDLNGLTLNATGATRKNPEPFKATRSYFVNPNGNGTKFTREEPGSLEDAVKNVQAGEEIVLLGGVYYKNKLVFQHDGIADMPITIRSAFGEKAIFDGSDTLKHMWKDEGEGIYSTDLEYENTRLIIANGRRLYQYNSMSDLRQLIWDLDGFYVDNKTVYVKITGKNPSDIPMIISKSHNAFTIWQRNYFHFRNLEFRYYGQGDWAKALYFYSSSYNIVDSCTFAINNLGVGIKYNSDQITVQNCEFYDDTDMWDWKAMKASIVESTLLSFYDPVLGRGHVIRNNIFHDCQDGMSPGSFYKQALTTELDIYNNTIYNAGDDGISVDGWASNVRVWNNTIYDVLVGISFAPVNKGPAYAIRNIIYNTGYGNSVYRGMSFKFNSGGYGKSGKMYLFHNTTDVNLDGVDGFECRIPGDWELIYSRNNAFTGNRYAISYIEGSGNRPLNMDFDNLYTSDEGKFAYWYDTQSRYYNTLNEFQSTTKLELNGISENPMFTSPSTGDFSLLEDSPLIDAGILIPGINDKYFGSNPDIGALETKVSSRSKDIISDVDFELLVYPNPSISEISIVLKHSIDNIDYLEVFDAQGRLFHSKTQINSRAIKLPVSQYKAGIYLLRIMTNSNKTIAKSFVIN